MNPNIDDLNRTVNSLMALHYELTQLLASRRGISLLCIDCHKQLSDEELTEALEEKLKEPVCNNCYQSLVKQIVSERSHPDCNSTVL